MDSCEIATLCRGLFTVEVWKADCSAEQMLATWSEFHTQHLPMPKYQFQRTPAQILEENTTIVWVELDVTCTLETPLSYFFESTQLVAGLPHMLFVARVDLNFVIVGSLLCRTFLAVRERRGQLRLSDLRKLEYPLLFAGLEVFDEPAYYHTSPNLQDRIYYPDEMDVAVRQKFIEIQNFTATDIPPRLQPVAFSLTLFAASASDRWSDRLIEHEAQRFSALLQRFNDFPYWQFELACKWLRVDWIAMAVPYWRLSDSYASRRGKVYLPTLEYTEFHCPPELKAVSHIIAVDAKRIPWANPFVQCNFCIDRYDCPRPTLRNGRVWIGLQMLPVVAVEYLCLRLRERIQLLRLKHHTTLGVFWYAKIRCNQLDKIADFVDVQAKRANQEYSIYVLPYIYEAFQRTFSARDNFRLETQRDCVVLWRTIIPLIWGDRLTRFAPMLAQPRMRQAVRERKHAEKEDGSQEAEAETPTPVDAHMEIVTEGRFDLSTYEKFIEHTTLFWPPCMALIARTYIGAVHMTHSSRRRVVIWLCALVDVYTDAEVWALWRWLMWSTSAYQHMALSGNFERTEMGYILKYELAKQRKLEKPYTLGCKSQKEKVRPEDPGGHVYCPYASGEMPDIEDGVAAEQQCGAELVRRTKNGGGRPFPAEWKVYTPHSFTREAIKRIGYVV